MKKIRNESIKKAIDQVLNEEDNKNNDDTGTESMVGTKLSAVTTKKVTIICLVMLLAQPLQDIYTYMLPPYSYS